VDVSNLPSTNASLFNLQHSLTNVFVCAHVVNLCRRKRRRKQLEIMLLFMMSIHLQEKRKVSPTSSISFVDILL
jgi:hypothetical protein